ncbi:MAG: hypothetical protein ACRC1P_07795 [Cellulosilyticaceae bacterium]
MGDVFKEQLVKAKPSTQDTMKKAGIIIGAILIGAVGFMLGGALFGPIIVVAAGWGAIYLSAFFKKEYEYSLTNHELDIDVIYNKQRRKRLMSIDLKQINVMASIKDDKYQSEIERGQKIIDTSNGEGTKDTYAVVFGQDGQTLRVLVTPNEDLLNLMHKQAPNKIHKTRL